MASVAISRVPCAVITMTGVSGASSRQRGITSMPSTSGSFTSSSRRSHGHPLSRSNMTAPVGATSTS